MHVVAVVVEARGEPGIARQLEDGLERRCGRARQVEVVALLEELEQVGRPRRPVEVPALGRSLLGLAVGRLVGLGVLVRDGLRLGDDLEVVEGLLRGNLMDLLLRLRLLHGRKILARRSLDLIGEERVGIEGGNGGLRLAGVRRRGDLRGANLGCDGRKVSADVEVHGGEGDAGELDVQDVPGDLRWVRNG